MTREEMLKKKIAVVYGGINTEREVSLQTGEIIHRALLSLGYEVSLIDMGRDLPGRLLEERIEVVFNALHGKWGEDGSVQGMLEVMGIPYTGSKVLASALALDKHQSKLAFQNAGLSIAPYVMLEKQQAADFDPAALSFELPAVVKPNSDGSSVAVSIVRQSSEFASAFADVFAVDTFAMIEKFQPGSEVQVTVLDGKALGAIEIVPPPSREFYDYEAKYLLDTTTYIYPARLEKDVYDRCLKIAEQANAAVFAESVTRVDLIVSKDGSIIILELNTLPGMTSHSLAPKTAAAEGIPFEELAERILLGASLGLHEPKESD